MLEWARFNRETLSEHSLYTTGTTGLLLSRELDLRVHRLLSGPYGGDAQAFHQETVAREHSHLRLFPTRNSRTAVLS
jgi:methylglyoxal synthase